MHRWTCRTLLVPVLVVSTVGVLATATPASAAARHGISVLKGCESPTTIGSLYECSYAISQNVSGDTATITGITDVATTAGGPVSSGNILPLLTLTLAGGASCNTGQTACTIPDGGSIGTADYAYYTVKAADFGLPNHLLSDKVTVSFTEVCTGAGASNCPIGTQTANAGSSTVVQQFASSTTTVVQLAGTTVTSVPLGSTVTDQATVSGTGAGTPTGTVAFTFFANNTCTGAGTSAGTGTLSGGTATSSPEASLLAGSYSFEASYSGDTNYAPSTGSCEPLIVNQGTSATTTAVQLGGTTVTSVPLGSTVTDQATVSGTGAGTPTGTVTFTFFTNGTCTGTGSPAGTGTLASGVASSSAEGPLSAVGSYSFQASYSGDSNYTGSTGNCEPFTVSKASTQTLTSVLSGTTPVTSVALGTSVTDQATVSGTGAGTPTGSVTFTFYANGGCTGTGTGAGTGTLASGVANSAPSGSLAAGSYSYLAVYSGDGNYLTSTGSCEPFTVGQANTVTVTTVQLGGMAVTGAALGSTVTDQATVTGTGAGTPTGTVTFTFYSNGTCAGTGSPAGTGTLAAGVANSGSEGPLLAGSYSFKAVYGGDSNYLGSTGACEPLTVNKAMSQTVTTVQQGGAAVTAVALGSSVTDQATVTGTGAGTPTGTVTFTFFSNGTCAGTGASAGTKSLSAGVATSNAEGSLLAGSYSFQATYSGDSNYLTSTGSCEPLTVNKAASQTVTAIQSGGQSVISVALGSTVTDQATVSGTGAGTPTGTVTFTFFANGTCAGTGTAAGTGTLSSGVATSSPEGSLMAGSYSFQATYSGDSNYLTSTGSCEPLTVPKAPSQTVTAVQQGGAAVTAVALGTSVTDQATVTGTGAGSPTGTVTFTFFANGTCAGTGSPAGTGTLASGVATSSSEGPLLAGSYSFEATYGGDANYLTSTGSCEPLTVNKASSQTVTTVQQGGAAVTAVALGTSVTDQATVTGTGAGTPTGTVTFTFFANGTCAGTGSPAGTGTLASGVASSSSEGSLAAGSYSFDATYSGDANYLTSTGACEPFTVGTGSTVTVTTVQQGGTTVTSVALGTSVTDQATVSGSGAGTPTGTVTFTFFANGTCAGTGAAAGTGPLTAGVATSSSEGPLSAAGPYSFQATYNGDSNYKTSTGSCEPFVVMPGPSQTVTTVQQGGAAVTAVALGSSVTDQATVTGTGAGTPTGTVTFTFFANATCAGTGTSAGTTALNGAGVANSNSEGPLMAAGSDSFEATYNGDSNYVTSTGGCEPFTVGPGSTVTVTTVQQGGSAVTTVALGTSVTDQATVSGSGAGTPTGTVTFTFFANATCAGTGTAAGTGTLASGVTNSNTVGPLTAAGTDSFQATYNGDANYVASTGACEPFMVSPAPAVVVTTVQLSGTNTTSVPAGSSVTDQATVSGTGAGTPTGTVTFTFFANGTCAGAGTPAGTGSLTSGVANSSTVGPLTIGGSYSFLATYNGDANYLSQTGSCEPFTVTPPVLTITKTADAVSVPAGNPIGFTITVSNASPGTATSVTVSDPLPAGPGISWSISPAYSGPGTCSISGAAPTQVLNCALGDMATGGSASVHIQSATTAASPGTYKNTATASSTNTPSVSASATITVTVPVIPHTSLTEKASVKIENNEIPVTFTYTEKNTGTVGITGVAVTGSLCGPATFVSSSNSDTAVLDPGATWIYTCTFTPDNKTAKVEKFTDVATASGTSVVTGLAAPLETAKATVKVRQGPGPCGISVSVSPNPLVETGQSEVHAVVQVEACAGFAGDAVNISSPQLATSCAGGISFATLQPGAHTTTSIQVALDDDGNVTVSLNGLDCAPGPSVIEASLISPPYLTAVTTLTALPPQTTTPGVVGYPANEVETGDTTASGNSDVYAVFYVETNPVYAEDNVEISSPELLGRCQSITWTSNAGATVSNGPTTTATLDNDGNAVITFEGTSCAAGTSTVIGDVLAGTHTTYTSSYTIEPPTLTPS
jgi:hypothetical protein